MRSKLFVPGSRPELFTKALSGPADGLSFDLEDAVRPEKKGDARAALAAFLSSDEVKRSDKTIVVRINPLGSDYFMDDLKAMVCDRIDVINLPKPESVEDIQKVSELITQVEQEKRLERGGRRPIGLLVNIETPRALRMAHEFAAAHERVMGLQLGLGDLFEPYGINRRETVAVYNAMYQVAMAAHEAGVQAYDTAFTNVADKEGFIAEARMARNLGFSGKSCIHPSQVEPANEVFRPSQAEIEFAVKVVQAEEQAKEASVGAYMVDGKMIDGPFVDRARNILKIAQQLGLITK